MEQFFQLTYFVPGMAPGYLEKMPRRERDWLYQRLIDQRKAEHKAIQDKSKE